MRTDSIVKEKQDMVMSRYQTTPEDAFITDVAFIEGEDLSDPFHTTVSINDELKTPFKIGVHRAVGGLHDYPNPGDLLCASLASCFETTMRLIADRLGVTLQKLQVRATADVDVRGTLMMDRSVPVNFQQMHLEVTLQLKDTSPASANKLIKGAETCCIVYQTLRKGIPVHLKTTIL